MSNDIEKYTRLSNLKSWSIYDLTMRLNEILKRKANEYYTMPPLELVELDYEWNLIVMELWERIPSLEQDVNIQPVLTEFGRRRVLKRDDLKE